MNRDYGDETDYDEDELDDNFYEDDEDDMIYWDELEEDDDDDEEDLGGSLILNHPYPKKPSHGGTMKMERELILV